ncbi:hypothetical protein tb265_04160 [Gemmatimonadetes bacterium T265]|nr:hypothetical protein tb265_04160 [Gemmatimonadetes bacterium T265]
MSLQPGSIPPVPEQTAAVARRAFRRPPLAVRLRDEFGALYADADCAALFPVRGQPALPPWRLALVTVLQFLVGLTDRQAADAVRARIDWKYAPGLELTDPGFDYRVLSECRARLVTGSAEQVLLDRLLDHAAGRGLVKARTTQRTDSTHVLAAVRTRNRLELVGESVRAARNTLAAAAPRWLRAVAPPEWHARYDHRVEEARMPSTGPARAPPARVGRGRRRAAGRGRRVGRPTRAACTAARRRAPPLARYYAREPAGGAPSGDDAAPGDDGGAAGDLRPRAKGELKQAPRAVESPYEADARYG